MLFAMLIVALFATEPSQSAAPPALDKALSLELTKAALLDAIDIVALDAGITVRFSPEVLASASDLPDVTLNAVEVPASELLDRLLEGGGLARQPGDGVLIIVKKADDQSAARATTTVARGGVRLPESPDVHIATASTETGQSAEAATVTLPAASSVRVVEVSPVEAQGAATTEIPAQSGQKTDVSVLRSQPLGDSPSRLQIEFHESTGHTR